MRAVLIVVGAVGVVGLLLVLLFLEPDADPINMRAVEIARGDGFEVAPPADYLMIDDPRLSVPDGAVVLGRRSGERPTIVIAAYPETDDRPLSPEGCREAARDHAKQVGAQLVGAVLERGPDSAPLCAAELSEGKRIAGRAYLRQIGDGLVMVTCRYVRANASDEQACRAVADGLR